MSTIRATVTDQKLVITDAPELASGGKGTNYVAFEFCELWDGFTKTAVFYNRPSKKYIMALGSDDVCDVPPEVTEKKGRMFFGVFGVDGDGKRKTSGVVPYFIGEGGYDEDAAPSEPTEEFWEQVLAEIAKSEEAVREAMGRLQGVTQDAETALRTAMNHKARHAKGGADELSPADIGAAEAGHSHTADDIDGLLDSDYDEENETLEIGDLFNGDEVSDEQIAEAVERYFEENPPETSGVTDEQIAQAVENYLVANPPQGGDVVVDDDLLTSGAAADAAVCGQKFDTIEQQIAQLMYVPIEITSFSHNAGTREKGESVSGIELSWVLNKVPDYATVGGKAAPTTKTVSGYKLDGAISSTVSYELKVIDDENTEAKKSTTVYFYDGIYYGCAEEPDSVDSEFILSLTKKLSSAKNLSGLSVTGGEGKFFWFAYPASMKESIFNIGGFDYEYPSQTISFTNKFGRTIDYRVYKSTYPIPGSISVTVKDK